MELRGWLLALLLTGCATEADRYCPVIRAQGVAAPSALAACAMTPPAGGMACPAGTSCLTGFDVGFCTKPCAAQSDCAGLHPSGRAVCLLTTGPAVCALTCDGDGDCPAGTECHTAMDGTVPCRGTTPCRPARFCWRLNC